MKVQEIMTTAPETCRAATNLAVAVERLWNADCGVLPVTDEDARLTGIITDRDICIALGTRNRPASAVRVDEVMRRPVEACRADEDVNVALGRMKDRRVRRLPVLDDRGRLVGMLSLNDVVLATGSGVKAVKPGVVMAAFKAICAHNVPAVAGGKADAA